MPDEEPPKKKGRGRSRNKVEDVESQQPLDDEPDTMELIGFLLVPLTISNASDKDRYSLPSLSKPYLQVR